MKNLVSYEPEHNKSEEPINYPQGNLLAHFKRYAYIGKL
jgi:hypothetical protein